MSGLHSSSSRSDERSRRNKVADLFGSGSSPLNPRNIESNGSSFTPRRSTFFGGLSQGPMGGLNMLDPISNIEARIASMRSGLGGPFGRGLGLGHPNRVGIDHGSGFGPPDVGDFDLHGWGGPMAGGGFRAIGDYSSHANSRIQPSLQLRRNVVEFRDLWATPMGMGRVEIPRSPLLEGSLLANVIYHPLSLRDQALVAQNGGRMSPINLNPQSPLLSRAGYIRSPRAGSVHGMGLIPRMHGGMTGNVGVGGPGNYRAPYVEDYQSEIDEFEQALRELELLEHYGSTEGLANYLWGPPGDAYSHSTRGRL